MWLRLAGSHISFTHSPIDGHILGHGVLFGLGMSVPPNSPLFPNMTTAIWSMTAYLVCALFADGVHI